jgi:hypothetical protein
VAVVKTTVVAPACEANPKHSASAMTACLAVSVEVARIFIFTLRKFNREKIQGWIADDEEGMRRFQSDSTGE